MGSTAKPARGWAWNCRLAWTLRRFERDLFDALGVGFAWDCDGDGTAIDPAARYRLDPEHGPRRVLGDSGRNDRSHTATGRALLDLAADREPCAEDMPGLRRVIRICCCIISAVAA